MRISFTRRQQRLYTDRLALFTGSGDDVKVDPATGTPLIASEEDRTYAGSTIVDGNIVPAAMRLIRNPSDINDPPWFLGKIVYTENVDDPSGVGRIKRFNMFTADFAHFPTGTPVDNASWVVNVTRLPDGSRHPAWGQVSKVLGAPKIVYGGSRRAAHVSILRINQEEIAPAPIQAFLDELTAQGE